MRKLIFAALLAIPALGAMAQTATPAPADTSLRHVFYFIGDGMGTGPVLTAQTFNRMVLGNEEPLLMTTFPVATNVYTYSYSSPVTDSAAAGTALATGVKTRNGMVGMSPDTLAVNSIARRLADAGWSVGIISSNAPDDATPASFYAHQPNRSMYYEIGRELATSGFDFFGGAPLRGLTDKKGAPTPLRAMIEGMYYKIVDTPEELAQVGKNDRVVALNNVEGLKNSLGYAIDGPTGGFTLSELVSAGISTLSANPDGFFMMVEDGLIDHSLHANDAPAAVRQVVDFQKAINVAYQFYLQHPENTLIVITADHDTGGLTLGNANPAVKYDAKLEMLAQANVSKGRFAKIAAEAIAAQGGNKEAAWKAVETLLANTFGFWELVPVTEAETLRLKALCDDAVAGNNAKSESLYELSNAFTDEVYNILHSHAGVAFISGYHTGGFVPLFAIGKGAEKFAAIQNNTDIQGRIWDIMVNSIPRAYTAH